MNKHGFCAGEKSPEVGHNQIVGLGGLSPFDHVDQRSGITLLFGIILEQKRVHLQVISICDQGQQGSRWLLGSSEAGVPVDVNLIIVQGMSADVSGPLSLCSIAATALSTTRRYWRPGVGNDRLTGYSGSRVPGLPRRGW